MDHWIHIFMVSPFSLSVVNTSRDRNNKLEKGGKQLTSTLIKHLLMCYDTLPLTSILGQKGAIFL